MASTGKKSKKQKWVKASITDIIAEPTTIPAPNLLDTADEETEGYNYGSSHRDRGPVVLPSASRAARGGMAVDEDAIPQHPPFVVRISNLPYEVDDSSIAELFTGLKINSLRIPKEGDRLKGFGFVDFEERQDLISALKITDPVVAGRRIRIEVTTNESDRRMGNRGGRNNDRDGRDFDPERTMGDWRSGPRQAPVNNKSSEWEGRDRERDTVIERSNKEREPMAEVKPGAWRDGDRPNVEPTRAPYGGRDSYGRDRADDRYGGGRDRAYGGRDSFGRASERDGGGFSRDRDRGFGGRGFGDRDRERDEPPRERPKLNLLPRTVPREQEVPTKPADGAIVDDKDKEKDKIKPVPAEKVFGAAKPVDTAAKEREIEERLRKQEEEIRRSTEEKERWGRKNDHSGDRRDRPGARRDDRDRPRDGGSYQTRRDYSKDDKDRRDYPRNDRDRRDYNDRRDLPRNRRDYSREDDKDDRGKRDSSDNRVSERSRERNHSNDRENRPNAANRRETSREYSSERERRDNSDCEDKRSEKNGRASRPRDKHEGEEKALPKMKEVEKPNFVASNKFSFLEEADDAASD